MDFSLYKKPIEVIKDDASGGTKDIYSGINGKSTESHEKNLVSWKISIRSIIAQIIMMSLSINMVLNAEHR